MSGILVPPRNPEALAQAIILAAGGPGAARRLTEEARRHVLERFSVERMSR